MSVNALFVFLPYRNDSNEHLGRLLNFSFFYLGGWALKRSEHLFIFSQNLGRTEKTLEKRHFVAVAFSLSFPTY